MGEREACTPKLFAFERLTDTLGSLIDFLSQDLGVAFTQAQLEQFIRLYTELNNSSHLWMNCGWRPDELMRRAPSGMPESISIGPNLRKMFEDGTMDQAEFEQGLRELGIKWSKG